MGGSIGVGIDTRRAKRRVALHPMFYFFDAGVFQAVRPRGPLDAPEEIRGPALETLFLQHLRAANNYGNLGWDLHYWRTLAGNEVDFVLHGPRGLRAFEVKTSDWVRSGDLDALRLFLRDYPGAKASLLYLGSRRWHDGGIEVAPFAECVANPDAWLA